MHAYHKMGLSLRGLCRKVPTAAGCNLQERTGVGRCLRTVDVPGDLHAADLHDAACCRLVVVGCAWLKASAARMLASARGSMLQGASVHFEEGVHVAAVRVPCRHCMGRAEEGLKLPSIFFLAWCFKVGACCRASSCCGTCGRKREGCTLQLCHGLQSADKKGIYWAQLPSSFHSASSSRLRSFQAVTSSCLGSFQATSCCFGCVTISFNLTRGDESVGLGVGGARGAVARVHTDLRASIVGC